MGDVLQQHRLAGPRRRHDQPALAFADGRHQVDDPGRAVLDRRILDFHLQPLIGVKRRQVVEVDLVRAFSGSSKLIRVTLVMQKYFSFSFGACDHALDRVAGAQRELPQDVGRDVDVVRAGQVVGRRASAGSRTRPAAPPARRRRRFPSLPRHAPSGSRTSSRPCACEGAFSISHSSAMARRSAGVLALRSERFKRSTVMEYLRRIGPDQGGSSADLEREVRWAGRPCERADTRRTGAKSIDAVRTGRSPRRR